MVINKKKVIKSSIALQIAICSLLMMSCGSANNNGSINLSQGDISDITTPITPTKTETNNNGEISFVAPSFGYDVDSDNQITSDFKITTDVVNGYTYDLQTNTYTITLAGSYTLSGKLSEGQIIINSPSSKITLDLSGVNVTNSKNSPIYI